MRNYEALIVFNMKGTETPVEELISTVAAAMKEEGADITATENAGRREFAYESNHLSAGQYVTYTFSAEPSAIRPIRERLRLNPQIHLQYYKVLGENPAHADETSAPCFLIKKNRLREGAVLFL